MTRSGRRNFSSGPIEIAQKDQTQVAPQPVTDPGLTGGRPFSSFLAPTVQGASNVQAGEMP